MNQTRAVTVASRAGFAGTSGERRRGLIGRDELLPGEGLIIPRCRQVHSFGMRFVIDVMFLDRSGIVVRAYPGLSPGRVSPVAWRARQVIELPAGTLEKTGTVEGDRVSVADAGTT